MTDVYAPGKTSSTGHVPGLILPHLRLFRAGLPGGTLFFFNLTIAFRRDDVPLGRP
jgi:hypothetical protein